MATTRNAGSRSEEPLQFRAAAPPAGEQDRGAQGYPPKIIGLLDLFRVAAESKFFSQDGLLSADAERELFERVKRKQGEDKAKAGTHDDPPSGKTRESHHEGA